MSELRPIFIVGSGRCGSTVFHDLLTRHPGTSWLSRVCDRRPATPEYNAVVMRGLRVPGLGRALRRLYPPSEVYRFWDHYCPGFSRPGRDLRASDVTLRVKGRLRDAMARAIPTPERPLLVKITGWSRIGFLRAIFPTARFIVITRDGRAVVASAMSVPWSQTWAGPEQWSWGRLPAEDRSAWEESGESFVVLSGLGWKKLVLAQEAAVEALDVGEVLQLRYEDMCANPLEVFKRTAEFCGLPWTETFESVISSTDLRNQNHKWRESLTPEQQAELQRCLRVATRETVDRS